ncbi:unnamed protein product [Ambrosiozyma monospora]|uniref:Unnamed protein product n=1 Tax=Ambrosiozyma monospora TaxID=43982 RepID=A0A9W6Z5K8_AMBMO|nr:unnamed protein product [Ambrosiozyma monospora]
MEIKISNTILNNPSSKTLSWISDLTNGHLVKEVPNFSKFIQGISALFIEDDNLDILPFWLPELETDIRKNPEQAYNETKKKLEEKQQHDETLKNLKKKLSAAPKTSTQSGTTHLDKIIEDGEDLDEYESSDDDSTNSFVPKRPTPPPQQPYHDDITGSSPSTKPHPLVLASSHKRDKYGFKDMLMPVFAKASKLEGYESEDEEIILPPGVTKPKTLIRQSGPVKVEAKVWLANERTFVRWLHVTTLLTALTFSVYASVNASHFPSLAEDVAYIYFALTLFSGAWAYAIYSKRLELIKLRSGKHLDGMFGPLVLGVVLVISLSLEFYAGVKKYNDKYNVLADNGDAVVAFALNAENEEVAKLHPLLQWTLLKIVGLVESI